MKTLWIEDEDALNVGRVIVTKTGTKDCVICYSCDEIDDYENRFKADMMVMLEELKSEIEESCICTYEVTKLIQQKIYSLKENKGNE